MKAADVMTRSLVTVSEDTAIAEAARLMLEHRISGLPVTDEKGRLCGVITEGDLLRRIEMGTERRRPRWLELLVSPGREAEDYVRSHARKVSDVMTGEVVTATPQTPLEDVVQLMERHHVKRVPVVERGKLVGIVSRANLLSALAKLFGAEPARPLTDAEITKRILEEIKKQPWAPRSSVEIAVENGVVELSGAVVDEREREALRVCAEIVPGVKEVRDRLAWIEPVSGMVIDAPPEPTQKGGAKR